MVHLRYVKGDATAPIGSGPRIIAHVCNDAGGWGAGFVVAISRRWPEPEAAYRRWHAERASNDFALGGVQLVPVGADIHVANMIGQHHVVSVDGVPPVRYEAIGRCLRRIAGHAEALGASVHMPRIGCGLAGGKWEMIEPLIARELAAAGITTVVYDFARAIGGSCARLLGLDPAGPNRPCIGN